MLATVIYGIRLVSRRVNAFILPYPQLQILLDMLLVDDYRLLRRTGGVV